MSRHVTVTLATSFVFNSEDFGIDFEAMSNDELRDFAIQEFWGVLYDYPEDCVDVDIHDNV